jgi:alpha-1,2-mannosyltransferase
VKARDIPADPDGIDTPATISFPMLRQSSYRHRLWLLAGAVAIFLTIAAGTEAVRRATAPPAAKASGDTFALDFIAFYTGGTFVAEGRHRDLFDLRAVQQYQRALAADHGVDLGDALGPWWNPPFYAWVFVPLAKLPFGAATAAWVLLNVAAAAVACRLLVRVLPPGAGWKTKALVPVLVALSVPFIHGVTHGQNAGTSLLIVTLVVTAWRAERPLVAGLLAGLMLYKPQHAVVLGGMLTLALGWRALAGLAITGTSLLLVTVVTLPGSLGDFLHQMPVNVRFVQEQCVYMWERHATLTAFWRLLVQGRAVGPPGPLVLLLTALSTAALAVALLRLTGVARWMNPFDATDRSTPEHRDRLIAATFLATPLLMPFYFDYDLLLLAVPAVLLAGSQLRTGRMIDGGAADRAVKILGPALYAWMLVNADFAERTHVNFTVPLLAAVAVLAVRKPAVRVMAVMPRIDRTPAPTPLARAA